jgi:hypothetical protein
VSAGITLFATINNTITARWESSVSSASSRSDIRVQNTIITLFTGINDSIVSLAVRGLGNVEFESGQERRRSSSNFVQEGKTNEAAIGFFVDKLSLQISVSTIDGVFGGGVEFDSFELSSIESLDMAGNKGQLSSRINNVDVIGSINSGRETSGGGVKTRDDLGVKVDG